MSQRGGMLIVTAFGVLILAGFSGLELQPKDPNLTGDSGYQEQATYYRAGGRDCEPAKLDRFTGRKRDRQANACENAEEEHRIAANGLKESRRSADAADAAAIAAYKQAGISAWGTAIGILTLGAAGFAAWYAKEAARHTEQGAKVAGQSLDKFMARERGVLAMYQNKPVEGGGMFTFLAQIKNCGGSWVTIRYWDCAVMHHIDGYPVPISLWETRDLTDPGGKPANIIVPSEKDFVLGGFQITPDKCVYAGVIYRDIFGNHSVLGYAAKWNGDGMLPISADFSLWDAKAKKMGEEWQAENGPSQG